MKSVHIFSKIDGKFLHRYFQQKKHIYIVETTGKSSKFIDHVDGESYIISSERIGFKLVNLMRRTKQDVKNNISKMKKLEVVKPLFYSINVFPFKHGEGIFENITEVDLSKAYLESAYRQNFISEKIYLELKNVSGSSRKRCLGALATKKRIKTYNELGEIIDIKLKQDDELIKVWNLICAGTDSTMDEIIHMNLKENFLFYWIDNIFLNVEQYEAKLPEKIEAKIYKRDVSYWINERYVYLSTDDNREFTLRY